MTSTTTSTHFYDYRAERLLAAGQAEIAKAQAAEIAAQARLRELDAIARADQLAEERAARARRHRVELRDEQRAARRAAWAALLAAGVRVQRLVMRVLPALAGLVACVAPAVIAFDGQFRFASTAMGLGLLGVLFPIMLEGVAWRLVWARQQALRARVDAPTARLTLGIWLTALTGAAMNVWHGLAAGSLQVGVAFGLASLVGFALVEVLNGANRRHRQGRMAGGLRVTVLRWLRFPRLSFAAWSRRIALGPQADPRAAWEQVWADRYGVSAVATGRERRLGRLIVRRDLDTDLQAVANGLLHLTEGRVGPSLPPAAREAIEDTEHLVESVRAALDAAALVFSPDALRSTRDNSEASIEQPRLSSRAAEVIDDLRAAITSGVIEPNPSVGAITRWCRAERDEPLGVPAAMELRDAVKGLRLVDPADTDDAVLAPTGPESQANDERLAS